MFVRAWQRPALLLALVSLSAVGHAQYGVTESPAAPQGPGIYYKLRASVSIVGVAAAGDPISGTKIDVRCDMGAWRRGTPPPEQAYSAIELYDGKLEIVGGGGSTTVSEDEPAGRDRSGGGGLLDGASADGPLSESQALLDSGDGWDIKMLPGRVVKGVRFASTHFPDGSTVTVRVSGTFYFYRTIDGVKTKVGEETISAEIQATAYNKLQTLGTNVDATGADALNFKTASDKTTKSAHDLLISSHTTSPGDVARYETQASILGESAVATVVSAMTHGDVPGIFQSTADPDASPTNFSTVALFSQIKGKVDARTPPNGTIPLFNLVGFWACKTIDPSDPASSPSVVAYRSLLGPDRALVGFDEVINIDVFGPDQWANYDPTDPEDDIGEADYDLGDHAELFWFLIHQGETVEEALYWANAAFPPTLFDGNVAYKYSMIHIGDPRTTLINVYLTASEEAALVAAGKPTNVWWVKL